MGKQKKHQRKTQQQPQPTAKSLKKKSSVAAAAAKATKDEQQLNFRIIFQLFVWKPLTLFLLSVICIPLGFLAHSLSLIYGRPPKMMYWSQTLRYLQYTWTYTTALTNSSAATFEENNNCSAINSTEKVQVELGTAARLELTFEILRHTVLSQSIFSLFWLLDEILYGSQLDKDGAKIEAPFFVLSGFRSASTQISRYLSVSAALVH